MEHSAGTTQRAHSSTPEFYRMFGWREDPLIHCRVEAEGHMVQDGGKKAMILSAVLSSFMVIVTVTANRHVCYLWGYRSGRVVSLSCKAHDKIQRRLCVQM